MIEQNLKPGIEIENLNKYKIKGTPEVIKRLFKYFNRIGKEIGFEFSDLTVSLGVSNPPDFPLEKVKALSVYLSMPEGSEKEKYKSDNKLSDDFINSYQNDLKKRDEKIKLLPEKLLTFWLENESEDMNEIFEIISLAIGIDIEVIKETDYLVLTEIVLRIIFRPENAVQQAFFLNLVVNLFKKFMALFNIISTERLNGLIR